MRFSFEEGNGKSLAERAAVKCVRSPALIFPLFDIYRSPFVHSPVGSVPYVELGGKMLTQSYPMLRLFARQLKAYDGTTDESKYFVDVINDLSLDWRTLFVTTAFVNNKNGLSGNPDSAPFTFHKEFNLPSSLLSSSLGDDDADTLSIEYVAGIEQHLATNPLAKGGPFVLGATITYADFVLYQIYHDGQSRICTVEFGASLTTDYSQNEKSVERSTSCSLRPLLDSRLSSRV